MEIPRSTVGGERKPQMLQSLSPPHAGVHREQGRFLSPKLEREAAALMAFGSEMPVRLSSAGTPGLPHSHVPLILKNLPREFSAWSWLRQFPKLHLGSALSCVSNCPHLPSQGQDHFQIGQPDSQKDCVFQTGPSRGVSTCHPSHLQIHPSPQPAGNMGRHSSSSPEHKGIPTAAVPLVVAMEEGAETGRLVNLEQGCMCVAGRSEPGGQARGSHQGHAHDSGVNVQPSPKDLWLWGSQTTS